MTPSSKMSPFEKRSAVRNYQFLAIIIAAVIFSSCQKEVNNPVPSTSITSTTTSSATALKTMYWTVGGVTREATVYIPSTSGYHPIVFGFHGKGGTGAGFGSKYCYFFDAMLSTFVNKYNANTSQVFCHGWSSGGEFIYNVLWTKRGTELKAISTAGAALGTTSGKSALRAMQIAGTNDPVCSFTKQQSTSQGIRNLDKCSTTGSTWATGPYSTVATHYSSSITRPDIFLKYDGNHTYPDCVPPLIVKFFKEVVANTIQ